MQKCVRRASWIMAAALTMAARPSVQAQPGQAAERREPSAVRPRAPSSHTPPTETLEGFDPLRHRLVNGRHVATLSASRKAVLTLDPGLQRHMRGVLQRYEVPWGAVVALEPDTGRVLAYVSHSSAERRPGDLARDASPPTASVFKVVTAAALLDTTPAGEQTRVCYHGGYSGLLREHLVDNPRLDTACATLSTALGHSINAVFAKLTARHLDRSTLRRYASAFGFGHALPFDAPTRPSQLEIPGERLEFARTAAGFWHMRMSPLHGALIAATVANDGVMPRAMMVERVVDVDGEPLLEREPREFRSVIGKLTARTLNRMMRRTVADGTAHGAFFDDNGYAFLPGIEVAGKTGSLSEERPYKAYSWWVGFAPADDPRIAVAALIVNSPRWRIKASYAAREALRYYLVDKPRSEGRGGANKRGE